MIERHPGAGKCLLHCEEQSFHIDVKDGVVELLGYGAQGGIPRNARIREHNVELTLLPLDLRDEAIQIARLDTFPCTPVILLLIFFTAAANSASRRPVMKTYAPSFTNSFVVAKPMPLLPPLMSASSCQACPCISPSR